MFDPEEVVIRQGQMPSRLYFISKGECEVWVQDENRKDTFVQTLTPGSYFGEIALITNQRRTATVQTKNYSNIGYIHKEAFTKILTIFPDLKRKMKQNMIQYQDKYKCWQKFQLLNIPYLRDLEVETYEELIIYLRSDSYQTGEVIIEQNTVYDRVFILCSGEMELFFQLRHKNIEFDVLRETGCAINSISCITQDKIAFSARALSSVSIMSFSLQDVQTLISRRRDLKKQIKSVTNYYKVEENKILLDYSRRRFSTPQKMKRVQGKPQKRGDVMRELFILAVKRAQAFIKYNREKEGKLQELIRSLKR